MPDPRSCRIILVRHGETEANRIGCFAASDDIELTDTGRQQAQSLGMVIRQRSWPVRVYASAFTRARQTADIISCELGLTVETLPGIHERNFGCLRGQPYCVMGNQMRADPAYDRERRWLWTPAGGESLLQVQQRALQALIGLAANCPGDEVLVVSHGAVMECVEAELASGWDTATVPENCGMIVLDGSAAGLLPVSDCQEITKTK